MKKKVTRLHDRVNDGDEDTWQVFFFMPDKTFMIPCTCFDDDVLWSDKLTRDFSLVVSLPRFFGKTVTILQFIEVE